MNILEQEDCNRKRERTVPRPADRQTVRRPSDDLKWKWDRVSVHLVNDEIIVKITLELLEYSSEEQFLFLTNREGEREEKEEGAAANPDNSTEIQAEGDEGTRGDRIMITRRRRRRTAVERLMMDYSS